MWVYPTIQNAKKNQNKFYGLICCIMQEWVLKKTENLAQTLILQFLRNILNLRARNLKEYR